MSASGYLRSEALVLRLTPYSESSMVAATLTPEHGQVHLMCAGARKLGRRTFPALDLYRRVEVVYRPGRSDLHTATEFTLLAAHDALARQPGCYRVAAWLAQFALRNTLEGAPGPQLFAALDAAFARLAEPFAADAPAPSGGDPLRLNATTVGVCFVLLAEHGLLPDLSAQPARQQQLAALLAFACTPGAPLPPLPAATWSRLVAWTQRHLLACGLHTPPDWPAPLPAPE